MLRVTAIKERKKALAGSVVKIAGRDVMLSKKIMISIVMVPLLWLFYAVLMMALTDWELSTKVGSRHSSCASGAPVASTPLFLSCSAVNGGCVNCCHQLH